MLFDKTRFLEVPSTHKKEQKKAVTSVHNKNPMQNGKNKLVITFFLFFKDDYDNARRIQINI